jgi:hypothetical protein
MWKDGVDSVRSATHHAQQFSAFLGLLSKRMLALSTIAPANNSHAVQAAVLWQEARIESLNRACVSIAAAKDRILLERKVSIGSYYRKIVPAS